MVKNVLTDGFRSARCKIISQYLGFIKRLINSVSTEGRILCQVAASDVRLTLSKNCCQIQREFMLNPCTETALRLKQKYFCYKTPEVDKWTLGLLRTLLDSRYELDAMGENLAITNELVNSLCSSYA